MKLNSYEIVPFSDVTINYDKKRIPLSSMKRSTRRGCYPYYGAQGIIDYMDDYIFDGEYMLIAEDGENLKSKKQNIAQMVKGKFWVNNHAHIIKNNERSDLKYLYYLFNSMDISGFITGSAQPKLSQANLNRIPIKIMDIDIQKKIGAILGNIDEKISLNNNINDNIEQLAQAVFKSWFIDFPVFKMKIFVQSPIGTLIPASMEMVQIANILHVLESGKRPKGGAVSDGIPSVGAENVKKLGQFNASSAKFIPVEFASTLKKGAINGYELLIYKDGGKPGMFTPHFSMFGEGFPYEKCYINEHVFKLDFQDRGLNEFAYFYFQTDYVINWLSSNGGKAAIPGINQQDIRSVYMYNPSHPKIREFCKWVQPLFTTILTNCAENQMLDDMRDTLLPKLISGELDVSQVNI